MSIDDLIEGYQFRGEYSREAARWLTKMDLPLFVTLTFAQNLGLARSRKHLGHWFGCLDYHYLGKNWSRRPSDERTEAIAFPENIESNLHYHLLLRLPLEAQQESFALQRSTLLTHWVETSPGGTCLTLIRNAGAARYVTKRLVQPGYWQHFVLAREFHSTRVKQAAPRTVASDTPL